MRAPKKILDQNRKTWEKLIKNQNKKTYQILEKNMDIRQPIKIPET